MYECTYCGRRGRTIQGFEPCPDGGWQCMSLEECMDRLNRAVQAGTKQWATVVVPPQERRQ